MGQTNLSVKAERVGHVNATKPDNLGVFEYAHLRAPLPKDLKGSEIFAPNSNQAHPESYFLMVRLHSDHYRWRVTDGRYRDGAVTDTLALLECSKLRSLGLNIRSKKVNGNT